MAENRRTHEKPKYLKAEQKVMKRLADEWGYEYEKLPQKYSADFALYNADDKVRAFVEIKTRQPTDQYKNDLGVPFWPTLFVSLYKWNRCMRFTEAIGATFVVVLCIYDGNGIWFYRAKPGDQDRFDVKIGGREDRGDPKDIEPLIHVPFEEFERFNHKKEED